MKHEAGEGKEMQTGNGLGPETVAVRDVPAAKVFEITFADTA